jgi:hypothetical protein
MPGSADVRRPLSVLLLLFSVAVSVAGQQPAPSVLLPSVTLPPELDRVLRDYERAWRAKDATALSDLFTKDGFVLSSGKPPVRGRAAILAAYAGSGGPLALRAFAYSTDARVGYIVGGFGGASGEPDSGKFVLILRKEKGRWQIAADMDNGNASRTRAPTPMPAPVTPPGSGK